MQNQSSDPLTAAFGGRRLALTAPQGDALRLVTRELGYGSRLTSCVSVNRQQNELSCDLWLVPPTPSLAVVVTTVPADMTADQTIQLPSAAGGTAALVGSVPPPDPDTGALPPPVLLVKLSGGQQTMLHWDGSSTLSIETPLATTAQVTGEPAEYQPSIDIDCVETDGSNRLTCSLPDPLPESLFIDVLLPAGWNLIAAPEFTASPYTGPLYTLQPGGDSYTEVAAGEPLALNAGYWLYLATPAPVRPISTYIPSVAAIPVPADQPALIGNVLAWPAWVDAATAVFRYDPAIGYIPVDTLPPGAGAIVYSASGSVALVAITPTPRP